MKKILIGVILAISLVTFGCESRWGSAGLGAVGGGAAAAGGYEYHMNREIDRLEEALERGEISREEYEIRRDQTERMSILMR